VQERSQAERELAAQSSSRRMAATATAQRLAGPPGSAPAGGNKADAHHQSSRGLAAESVATKVPHSIARHGSRSPGAPHSAKSCATHAMLYGQIRSVGARMQLRRIHGTCPPARQPLGRAPDARQAPCVRPALVATPPRLRLLQGGPWPLACQRHLCRQRGRRPEHVPTGAASVCMRAHPRRPRVPHLPAQQVGRRPPARPRLGPCQPPAQQPAPAPWPVHSCALQWLTRLPAGPAQGAALRGRGADAGRVPA
jgi:hypothetical protein